MPRFSAGVAVRQDEGYAFERNMRTAGRCGTRIALEDRILARASAFVRMRQYGRAELRRGFTIGWDELMRYLALEL